MSSAAGHCFLCGSSIWNFMETQLEAVDVCLFVFILPYTSNFNQMVGTYEELQAYLKEYVEELSRSDERRNAL